MKNKTEEKIDRILEMVYNTQKDVAIIKEHLKQINGSISDYKNQSKVCYDKFETINRKIWMATGGLSVLSIVALTKAIGIW